MRIGRATSNFLIRKGPCRLVSEGLICLALAHNEARILPDFLDYYRTLGAISFLIVDDCSTDETPEILRKQPDVTVFQPIPGSTYANDKKAWRSELLDKYADNAWCLVPDVDEHFVYMDMEKKSLHQLIRELEREGAQALLTIMVDMYTNKPLSDHVYTGGGLLSAFPLFDGPAPYPLGYHRLLESRRHRQKYPCPEFTIGGGMRDRLFFSEASDASVVQRYLMNRFSNVGRPLNPESLDRISNYFTRCMLRRTHSRSNMAKLGLLYWQKGMSFSGGAHAVTRKLILSESTAAFLHFKFTQGMRGLRYVAERGQHTRGGLFYDLLLNKPELLSRSPVCETTQTYRNSASLAGIIR